VTTVVRYEGRRYLPGGFIGRGFIGRGFIGRGFIGRGFIGRGPPRCRTRPLLQLGALGPVARAAQELDIRDGVGAAAADRDHVVKVQLSG